MNTNTINIVLSNNYQNLLSKYFDCKSGKFATYGEGELMVKEQKAAKAPFIINKPKNRPSKVRNQIINDAFVYWSDGTVMMGLIYSQKNKIYTGGVNR
jgi:hypothetical protein